MAVLSCFLCGKELDQRMAKSGKPYFVCDPCGTQFFVRRRQGIEQLNSDLRRYALVWIRCTRTSWTAKSMRSSGRAKRTTGGSKSANWKPTCRVQRKTRSQTKGFLNSRTRRIFYIL